MPEQNFSFVGIKEHTAKTVGNSERHNERKNENYSNDDSRQYCDAYHLLENVARWEKPEVFGVAKKGSVRIKKQILYARSYQSI